MTGKEAGEQVLRGALWSIGAVLVGAALGTWLEHRREHKAAERLVDRLEREGWALVPMED